MTKIKIGGQKYNLDELPESFRNRIKSELDKEGIKYDDEDVDIKKSDKKIKKNEPKTRKKVENNASIFRKMFGYP